MKNVLNLLLTLTVILLIGCSGTTQQVVTTPDIPDQTLALATESSPTSDHSIMGIYTLGLESDGEFTLIRNRNAEIHFDITHILFPPNCIDCFVAKLEGIDGNQWDFEFTIRNPTQIVGYDCRVTLLEMGDIEILNPTSYTTLFALPDDPNPINPFVYFDTGNNQNEWVYDSSASADVSFIKPGGTKFTAITFVVTGSYPANQEDPYSITGIDAEPSQIHIDGVGSTTLVATVNDWQQNVNYVTVDLTPLGGSGTAQLENLFANTWIIQNVHYNSGGFGAGTYDLLITAGSTTLETYNYVRVTVDDGPTPPAIFLETPNGGEHWVAGQDYDITWTDHNVSGPMTISYSVDDFVSDETVIETGVENTGTYNWTVDEAYSETVKVKVSWDLEPTVFDTSFNFFSIINTGDCDDPPVIVENPLPDAQESSSYSYTLTATDGEGPKTWQVLPDGDQLPAGLMLETNGELHGTPDTGAAGDYNLHIQAYDSCDPVQIDDAWFNLTVNEPDGWVETWSGDENVLAEYVITNSLGEIYTCGYWRGTADFDPSEEGVDERTSPDDYAAYISKFDTFGNRLWTTTWECQTRVFAYTLALDSMGNIYVGGYWVGLCDFDPGPGLFEATASNEDAYVSKFDSNGNYITTWLWQGYSNESIETIAVDSFDNLYAGGHFNTSTLDLDPGDGIEEFNKVGEDYSYDSWISVIDDLGEYSYGIHLDEAYNNLLTEVDICPTGRFYASVTSQAEYNQQLYISTLKQFEANGVPGWSIDWGTDENQCETHGIDFDSTGNIYILGEFIDDMDLDPTPEYDMQGQGLFISIYLVKYTPDGAYEWGRSWNSREAFTHGRQAIAVDNMDSIYVNGSYRVEDDWYPVDFDPDPVDEESYLSFDDFSDIYLSKFDTSGDLIWNRVWLAEQPQLPRSVSTDYLGNVVLSGRFRGEIDFDPGDGTDIRIGSDAFYCAYVMKLLTTGYWY